MRPTLEYGSEVWEGNKSQTAALESVMLGGAKRIHIYINEHIILTVVGNLTNRTSYHQSTPLTSH